jgi:hypothetical protein
MGIGAQEHERIREDETARWLVRQELRRHRRPQLLVIAFVWTLTLTALAVVFMHYRP